MLWETCVPQTTLGVAFGARLRSIPLGLLDRPLGHLDAKAAQGLQNGAVRAHFGPPTSPSNALRTSPQHACDSIFSSDRVSSS